MAAVSLAEVGKVRGPLATASLSPGNGAGRQPGAAPESRGQSRLDLQLHLGSTGAELGFLTYKSSSTSNTAKLLCLGSHQGHPHKLDSSHCVCTEPLGGGDREKGPFS